MAQREKINSGGRGWRARRPDRSFRLVQTHRPLRREAVRSKSLATNGDEPGGRWFCWKCGSGQGPIEESERRTRRDRAGQWSRPVSRWIKGHNCWDWNLQPGYSRFSFLFASQILYQYQSFILFFSNTSKNPFWEIYIAKYRENI